MKSVPAWRGALWKSAAFLLPMLLGAFLAQHLPDIGQQGFERALRIINATEAAQLESVFDELGYAWPPQPGAVPSIAVQAMPVDLHTLSPERRKAIFFRILAPMVAAENRKLLEARVFLQQAFARYPTLPESGRIAARVHGLASRFNVAGDMNRVETRETLLRRVDAIPVALVLAQAANESGWGTSRFAREANNLFGMWTWDRKSGLIPKRRSETGTHFIRIFDDLNSAVANYLQTINVGPAYRELRDLRATARAQGREPDALELVGGLHRYSSRGNDYVSEIRNIIRYNKLQQLPDLKLEQEQPSL